MYPLFAVRAPTLDSMAFWAFKQNCPKPVGCSDCRVNHITRRAPRAILLSKHDATSSYGLPSIRSIRALGKQSL